MVRIISPGSRQTDGGNPRLIQVAPAGAVADTQPHFASETGNRHAKGYRSKLYPEKCCMNQLYCADMNCVKMILHVSFMKYSG